MKKLLVSILALTLGVCAYAKKLDQLTVEFSVLKDKSARVSYVNENLSDIKNAYQDWVDGGRKTKERRVFLVSYYLTDAFDNLSDYEQACLAPRKLFRVRTAEDPTWYEDVKSGGFVLNGQKLADWQIFSLSTFARDIATTEKVIARCDISVLTSEENFASAVKVILQMTDVELAKKKLIELQTAIALRNPQDARLDTLKTYLRIVREKCIDVKLK